jgi:hypothetical protein
MTTSRTEPGMSAIANAGFSLADEARRMRRRLIAHIEAGGTTDLAPGTLSVPASVYTDPARLAIERHEMLLQQNHRLIADLIGMPIVS